MPFMRKLLVILSAVTLPACVAVGPSSEETAALNPTISNDQQYNDSTGTSGTYSSAGVVSTTSPFFQSLGTNGRTCFSCHQLDQGWTITPAAVQTRFDSTSGSDPIFASVDGTNSPTADVSTLAAKTAATTMLRQKGLIRIGLPIPAGAEFTLFAVDDPYHFASAAQLSLFRRPLPTTNVRFLTTVMWDGRENVAGQTIDADLLHQANSAMLAHAQAATSLTAAQERAIVDFMEGLYTAQIKDQDAKDVASMGSVGGPDYLATQSFYVGINDLFGDAQTKAAFNPIVFSLYDQWAITQTGTGDKEMARLSMLRGQTLFNTKPIQITGVAGINDSPAFGSPGVVNGTCTTCHDTPNLGNHSVALPINIGIADGSRRTADLPLYTLRNTATGATVQVTDPGRALVTGKWADIGKFKGPILRGLAARAPYFHNGFAASLTDVVSFYQTRFGIGFTAQETADLLMFLRSL
jgi:cytochrome c peroxidase